MQARMKNPAMIFPETIEAVQAIQKAAEKAGVPAKTFGLIELRASQINGCSVCVDMHARLLKKAGETGERLYAVTAWRDAPYFTDAERATLVLTETVTRLSDRPDPVPDEIWSEAVHHYHYNEQQLAALLIRVALINVWNRLNVTTRQVAGEWVKLAEARKWVEAGSASR